MAHIYQRASLFLLLFLIISEGEADSPVTVPVSAHKGGDAVLSCFNSTVVDQESGYRVRLVKHEAAASPTVLFAWPQEKQEATRVIRKQALLYLTDVRKSDEGLYSCEVCKGWECTVKNISLKVKDCKTSPPVRAALGSAIQLNCSVDSMSGAQRPRNISWAMLKGGDPVSVELDSNRIKVTNTSLVIRASAAGDGGWYRCQYLLGQTQRCFDINLHVQVEKAKATAVPVTAQTTQQAGSAMESTGAFTVVAPVVIVTVMVAPLMGLLLYWRRTYPRDARQAQTRPAGAVRQSVHFYEPVDLTYDSSVQQVNRLYEDADHMYLC